MDFISIQYLRAVSALAVVVFHVETQLRRMGYADAWPMWLASGVDVFFVISGFIMIVTSSGRSITTGEFYQRRIVRVAPLYWVLTLFMVLVQLASPSLLQSSKFELEHAILSLLFIPAVHPVLGKIEPVLVPGWTLNYEMFFYLIFGAALTLRERLRVPAMLAVLVLLVALGYLFQQKNTVVGFYTSSILLEFGFGVIVASMYVRGVRLSTAAALAMLAAGIAALVWLKLEGLPRAICWGIPAAFVVAGAVWLEASMGIRQFRLPRFLGDASYSIYLAHGFALSAFSQLWRGVGLTHMGHVPFVIASTIFACAVGAGLYLTLEKPLTRAHKSSRPRQVPAAA